LQGNFFVEGFGFAGAFLMDGSFSGFDRMFSEFAGTFALVFSGGAAGLSAGALFGQPVAGIAAGLAYFAMALAFYRESGAQFNPAVTFALFFSKRIGAGDAVAYSVSQLLGSILAALLLFAAFPQMALSGMAAPQAAAAVPWNSAVLLEAALTFLLVVAYLAMRHSRRPAMETACAVSAVMFAAALAIGPSTGAALNPARSFGPSLVGGSWNSQSAYWFGPLIGALAAAVFFDGVLRNRRGHGLVA
jgi:glycerol uptake facilitator-like aquaporin